MKLKTLFLVGILILFPLLPAKGQGAISPTIGVSPAKFFETVQPGKEQKYTIKLRNLGGDPLPLSASITDIDGISEDGVPIFSQTVSTRSASTWLKLTATDVIILPGETKELAITVTPPKDVAPGGYTAAIMFQAQLPSYYFDLDASARILPAISVLAFFTIAGEGEITVDRVSLENLRVPPLVVSSPVSLIAEVKNGSNFFVQADAETSLKGTFSSKSITEKIGPIILLPENHRKFTTAFDNKLWPGVYTASINFKQGDKVLVGSVKFIALPWPFIILVIAVALLGLGIAARRRFKRAWAVLRGQEHSTAKHRPQIR